MQREVSKQHDANDRVSSRQHPVSQEACRSGLTRGPQLHPPLWQGGLFFLHGGISFHGSAKQRSEFMKLYQDSTQQVNRDLPGQLLWKRCTTQVRCSTANT
jgi:hypothetical protein